jgi:hypothetical protein
VCTLEASMMLQLGWLPPEILSAWRRFRKPPTASWYATGALRSSLETVRARVLPTERLFPTLIAKLLEEADELASAAPADVLGELADFHSGSHGA